MTQRPEDDSPSKAQPPQAKKKRQHRNQDKQLKFYCTAQQFNKVASKAKAAGMKTGPWALHTLLSTNGNAASASLIDYETLRRTWDLERRVGNNGNQIAYQLNRQGMPIPEEVRTFFQNYIEIQETILQALGKRRPNGGPHA